MPSRASNRPAMASKIAAARRDSSLPDCCSHRPKRRMNSALASFCLRMLGRAIISGRTWGGFAPARQPFGRVTPEASSNGCQCHRFARAGLAHRISVRSAIKQRSEQQPHQRSRQRDCATSTCHAHHVSSAAAGAAKVYARGTLASLEVSSARGSAPAAELDSAGAKGWSTIRLFATGAQKSIADHRS
jgi:hypothetical protein